jgi:hypothetical protein
MQLHLPPYVDCAGRSPYLDPDPAIFLFLRFLPGTIFREPPSSSLRERQRRRWWRCRVVNALHGSTTTITHLTQGACPLYTLLAENYHTSRFTREGTRNSKKSDIYAHDRASTLV